ncbi:MAG: carboxypeptidase regulatory-like domain-containing protein [Proteobacteria bacterium]|nr:carboxypeptidase regulatory-like domain-containing protein [Pseudomonadota bacterium]MCP4918801.1 carboxypeptidase regulatory-like domain-containing protein [Pseudomonadota bacterium]
MPMWLSSTALAGMLSGVVTGPDGAPLAGVTVVAYDTQLASTVGTSSEDGTWSLEVPDDRRYRVRFVPLGQNHVERYHVGAWDYCDAALVDPGQDEVDVMLPEGGVLSGVVASGGEPVAGAIVRCRGESTRARDEVATTTDSDGVYACEGLDSASSEAADYTVRVEQPGHPDQYVPGVISSTEATLFRVQRGMTTEADPIELLDGVTVSGWLDGSDGPVVGASVHLYSGGQVVSTVSDADGGFQAEGVPEGDLIAWASREGWSLTYWPDDDRPMQALAVVEDEVVEDLTLFLEDEAALVGLVEVEGDASGITLLAFNDAGTVGIGAQVEEDGAFRIGRLHEGSYSLFVYAEPEGYLEDYARDADGERRWFDVEYGTDSYPVLIEPQEAAAFRGTVTDEQGAPVYGATVYATSGELDPGLTKTAEDGTYELRGLSAADWEVEVFQGQYCLNDPDHVSVYWAGTVDARRASTIAVAAGEVVEDVDFVMPIDSDHDGMGDGWEDRHGLHVGRNDAAEDKDQDGVANLTEYLDGTNPNDTVGCRGGCDGGTGAGGFAFLGLLLVRRRR